MVSALASVHCAAAARYAPAAQGVRNSGVPPPPAPGLRSPAQRGAPRRGSESDPPPPAAAAAHVSPQPPVADVRAPRAGHAPAPRRQQQRMTMAKVKRMKIPQLRAKCIELGLSAKGAKCLFAFSWLMIDVVAVAARSVNPTQATLAASGAEMRTFFFLKTCTKTNGERIVLFVCRRKKEMISLHDSAGGK